MNQMARHDTFQKSLHAAFAAIEGRELPENLRRRSGALHRFGDGGLPGKRLEEWKYSDLSAQFKSLPALHHAGEPKAGAVRAQAPASAFSALSPCRIVCVDGMFDPARSDLDALAAMGVHIARARMAGNKAASGTGPHPGGSGFLSFAPDAPSPLDAIALADGAVNLSLALYTDGIEVVLPERQALERPIEFVIETGSNAPCTVMPQIHLVAGDLAEAVICESHCGGGPSSFINTFFHVHAGAGSQITMCRHQANHAEAVSITSSIVNLERDATFRRLSVVEGAAFSRDQIFLRFAAAGSSADINGMNLLGGTQHGDQTLVIDHAEGHCNSREEFRAVIDDSAQSVFQGKIIVRPDAQKTDGRTMARALILSPEARAFSKPELEIFADDVQCGHGSTCGEPDDDMLFYLRSRGLGKDEAEALMIRAFLGELVDLVGHDELSGALGIIVDNWLARRHS